MMSAWIEWLYSLAWVIASPLAFGYLLWRSRAQPAYRRHLRERWGWHHGRDDNRPLIWIHAVSVGETRAAAPLVHALRQRYPGARVLLTAMTPTGRQTARELFGDTVARAYLPYDLPCAIRGFLRAWRPSIAIVMETELWPMLVRQTRAAGIPVALVNARLSERSLRKGRKWGRLIRDALSRLDLVAAQTDADARRLAQLAPVRPVVTGNLKFDVDADGAMIGVGQTWRAAIGRPTVVAASTRDGEEGLLLAAWSAQAAHRPPTGRPRPLLCIVPRHPQRFDEVEARVREHGLIPMRRSTWTASAPTLPDEVDVLLGDSMGEMAAYYSAADVAIIGGSLLPFGGQNLIEACALGVPVVIGPHTHNFAQAAAQAAGAGAALRVADAQASVDAALGLLGESARRAAMAQAGRDFAQRHQGATQRTVQALSPWLTRLWDEAPTDRVDRR